MYIYIYFDDFTSKIHIFIHYQSPWAFHSFVDLGRSPLAGSHPGAAGRGRAGPLASAGPAPGGAKAKAAGAARNAENPRFRDLYIIDLYDL